MTNEMLKERLLFLGINKKEFAEKFNISQSAVNNWSNKPIPSWVDAVVDLLDELHDCKQILKDSSVSNPSKKEDELEKMVEEVRVIRDDLKEMYGTPEELRKKLTGH